MEDRKGQEREEGRKGGGGRMKMEEENGKRRKGKEEEVTSKDGKRTILSVRKLAQCKLLKVTGLINRGNERRNLGCWRWCRHDN